MTDRLLTELALARGPLRDDGDLRQRADWWSAAVAAGAEVLDVGGDGVAADPATGQLRWRPPDAGDEPTAVLLGVADHPRIAVLAADPHSDPHSDPPVSLRLIGAELSDVEAALATTAVALAQWHRTHAFCPRCGSPTTIADAGWSRSCLADGSSHFPRTDPAVIVLVRDPSDRALLGRRADWPTGWYSTLAGFVEAGESAEHTLRREVFEEAGIVIDPDRMRYRGSQPWPFPGSLMLGFHAWSVDARPPIPDGEEIAEARWFSRADIARLAADGTVRIPPRVSIARHLIEDWYGAELPGDWSRP